MSVTDGTRSEQWAGDPGPPEPRGDDDRSGWSERRPSADNFERTPPQDVAAEQCVLGGMLLSKDAIADVVEILRAGDFYRPTHTTVFEAILDLYGRGEPADAITVAAALADSGALAKIGGAAYLHTLMSAVPTAANASYYARIVAERAVLRRLVEAGTRIVQLGYGSGGGAGRDVDDVVDLAQQAIYDVTEKRVSEDFAVLAEMLQPTLDEIEAVGAQGGVMTGVPTGFTDLDRLLNGLHAGQLIIVAGRPGLGKALALDTPLPTPDGWTTMGEVQAGDRLLGADGRPTTVVHAFEVLHGRPCYEVEFSDGSTIVADAEHLWKTTTSASRRQRAQVRLRHPRPYEARAVAAAAQQAVETGDRLVTFSEAGTIGTATRAYVRAGKPWRRRIRANSRQARFAALGRRVHRLVNVETTAIHPGVVTTAQIAASLRRPTAGRSHHAVTNCRPLSLPHRQDLPVPPYTLGLWLGDGDTGNTLAEDVRLGGPRRDKHIPSAYLRASEEQRRAVLAGLLDTAGTVSPTGSVQLTLTSQRLAQDARELIVSLGYHCSMATRALAGRAPTASIAYTLTFVAVDDVFRLDRKRIAHRERRRSTSTTRSGLRFIVSVRQVPSVPVRCVTVDNDDHLYLAGRSMIPTHNSTAAMDFSRAASVKHNMASAIFSLEMSKVEIVMRLLSAEARVPLHVLRSGQLSDDDWTKLARRMGEISEAPLYVDDTPNMNLMEIRAKARRLKQRHDLKLIVVDYLQLMTSPKRTESRQQEVADLSRGLKLLAKEVECPVVAVSQLNRGPEQRTDKRPQLSDLRESGCLTAATRVTRADTNEEVSLGDLLASNSTNIPVWALDERLKYVPRTMTHVFPSGRRPVFRMTLTSGRQLEATANHPFLTIEGWKPLDQLMVGSRLAVPRHVPGPLVPVEWPDDEVILLARQLGDGSFVARRDEGDLHSHDKFIPGAVLGLSKRQIRLFLRHLWATDGSVTLDGHGGGRVHYTSTSRRLIEGVASLLLRFGITCRTKTVTAAKQRAQHTLEISGRDDQLRFLREIGAHGERGATCLRLVEALEAVRGNTNVDTIPKEIWGRVKSILVEQDMSHRQVTAAPETQFGGSTLSKPAPSRARLARVAAVLDTAQLDLLATNDVLWDEVEAIEAIGEQDVFDATVLGHHNFIANGIAVHNSIEQDADVVILLHRDDYYDKESPRAGEADFIVAKHRNGPTDTVTVAAQLHLSRFVDMAI